MTYDQFNQSMEILRHITIWMPLLYTALWGFVRAVNIRYPYRND